MPGQMFRRVPPRFAPIAALAFGLTACFALSGSGGAAVDPPAVKATVSDRPPNVAYQTVAPGKTLRFSWIAPDLRTMEGVFAEVVLNGRYFQSMERPLAIRVRQPVRGYVVDAGPSHFSALHVIGTLFQTVMQDGYPLNVQHGIQTLTIPRGGAAIAQFTVYQPGHYPFVTHQFGDADRGAMGRSTPQ